MCAEGLAQAENIAKMLHQAPLSEIISSPAARSVKTAQIIGRDAHISVARDPRLAALDVGGWEGKSHSEIRSTEQYAAFVREPVNARCPNGESLQELQTRSVAAVEQALEDNPSGDAIAIVSHEEVIRVLLVHYMAAPLTSFHHVTISPGSVSVLGFGVGKLPRILSSNATDPSKVLYD